MAIDKIGKEDLLRLVNWTLHESAVSFDEYDEKTIKNQAHQLIYKSIAQKLGALRSAGGSSSTSRRGSSALLDRVREVSEGYVKKLGVMHGAPVRTMGAGRANL